MNKQTGSIEDSPDEFVCLCQCGAMIAPEDVLGTCVVTAWYPQVCPRVQGGTPLTTVLRYTRSLIPLIITNLCKANVD